MDFDFGPKTPDHLRAMFQGAIRERNMYERLYAEHFGDRPFEDQLKAMKIARDVNRDADNITVREFHQRLADELLVVPAEKDNPAYGTSIDQFTIIERAYHLNSGIWDQILKVWERSQNGQD